MARDEFRELSRQVRALLAAEQAERISAAQQMANELARDQERADAGSNRSDEGSQSGETSSGDSPQGQRSNQGGQAGGESGERSEGGTPDPNLLRLLEAMAERRLHQLDELPNDPAGAIRTLTDYDFMTPEARQHYADTICVERVCETDAIVKQGTPWFAKYGYSESDLFQMRAAEGWHARYGGGATATGGAAKVDPNAVY